nr:MAG TPA: hypothetical protein [Caudoviricetes sp.]DAU70055.1 MAG TPA: hypothetical protein [Bacteriophage sp.]DAH74430.1 MAG TPA: hypothetical protein [Caudoviricetes sp.]DAI48206.1 MAG TPA: hypothetical protein [Caudoviricetes sp.]DAK71439.1 MAG TPA: hypothetical protein [Caudoviricetes sp.]
MNLGSFLLKSLEYNIPKSIRHPYGMKMYAELIGNYKNYRIKSL